MKIFIGADHAGFELKEKLKTFLKEKGYNVIDKGASELNPEDDYPDFIRVVAEAVAEGFERGRVDTSLPDVRGVIVGGSGQGEAIAANRVKGARAAVFYASRAPIGIVDAEERRSQDPYEIIRLTRMHNDANILSIGARFITEEEAKKAIEIFLATTFEGGRHLRRVTKIEE